MPSPLALQLASYSQTSNTSKTHQPRSHCKASGDKPGFVRRTSSTLSVHRTVSGNSNASTGTVSRGGRVAKQHHHHPHVAHTSASTKHNRATNFGHRVPSYGKGLNKLSAFTPVNADGAPKEHVSFHSMVASGTCRPSMQRSLSEGEALGNKERRRSSSSVHSAQPKLRRSVSSLGQAPIPKVPSIHEQHIKFSTRDSSDEDEDDDATLVHRKSSEIVESPRQHDDHEPIHCTANRISTGSSCLAHSPQPSSPKQQLSLQAAQKSASTEGLACSAPKFLQKSLSSVALAQPKVSLTNAVSKDLAKSSTSAEHQALFYGTPSSEFPTGPSSHPSTFDFVTYTPPFRSLRTPDLDHSAGAIRRNQSATSLATTAHGHTIPLSTVSQGKLTRTQQKLLLQRASTQPLAPQPMKSYDSPSLQQASHMESIAVKGGGDYFAAPIPLTSTPAPSTPGIQVNIPYDIKVAREFDRISKELVNARRFGDPATDAISRLRERIGHLPASQHVSFSSSEGQTLAKKSSAFGLSMAWKRSPDKSAASSASNPTSTKSSLGDEMFGVADREKVKEIIKKLWFDEADLADFIGMTKVDDDEELALRRGNGRRGGIARCH